MAPTGIHVSGFSREQKTGFVFMLVFAIMTIGLGALQLRNTIYGPFVIKPNDTPSFSSAAATDEARLKSIDTDHDGLNDFEELNQYTTSPYLADTDSDGDDDKTEIDKGEDPLCPKTKECANADATGSLATSTVASALLGDGLNAMDALSNTVSQIAEVSSSSSNGIELEAIINDPAQLRTLILSTGKIDAATLDKIDNVSLQKMARNLFSSVITTSTPGAGTPPVSVSTTKP